MEDICPVCEERRIRYDGPLGPRYCCRQCWEEYMKPIISLAEDFPKEVMQDADDFFEGFYFSDAVKTYKQWFK